MRKVVPRAEESEHQPFHKDQLMSDPRPLAPASRPAPRLVPAPLDRDRPPSGQLHHQGRQISRRGRTRQVAQQAHRTGEHPTVVRGADLRTLATDRHTAQLRPVEALGAGPDVFPTRSPLYDTVAETLTAAGTEVRPATGRSFAATALATSAVADNDSRQLDFPKVELGAQVRKSSEAGLLESLE